MRPSDAGSGFRPLVRPTVFIASPSDVAEEREEAARTASAVASELFFDVDTYWWEKTRIWDVAQSWQKQIPRPSDPNCKITICILGEKLGSPLCRLENGDLLPQDFRAFVTDKGLPIDLDGSDPTKIPLTGSVFELVDAWLGAEKHGNKVLLFLKGDQTIRDEKKAAHERHLGNWAHHKRLEASGATRNKDEVASYHQQKAWLLQFYDEILFKLARPHQLFLEPSQFEAHLTRALWNAWGDNDPITPDQAFKGLSSFEVADHEAFFGRARETRDIISMLIRADRTREQRSFLVVHGRSGSGKSSLVKAGVAGALVSKQRWIAPHEYRVTALTPEDLNPNGDEAGEILHLLGLHVATAANLPQLREELLRRQTSLTVSECVATLGDHLRAAQTGQRTGRFLLVLDQFERAVGRFEKTFEEKWAPIIEVLDHLTQDRLLWVIVCLPSSREEDPDAPKKGSWLRRWNEMPAVQTATKRGGPILKYHVAQPTEADYQSIITEPFRKLNLTVDPGLVQHLTSEVRSLQGGMRPVLPLISMLLSDCHKAWELHHNTFPDTDAEGATTAREAGLSATPNSDDEGKLYGALDSEGRRNRALRHLTLDAVGKLPTISSCIQELGQQAIERFRSSHELDANTQSVLANVLRYFVRLDRPRDDIEDEEAEDASGTDTDTPTVVNELRSRVVLRARGRSTGLLGPSERRFVDVLAQARLLESVARDTFILVHETVLFDWDMAHNWLKREEQYLLTHTWLGHEVKERLDGAGTVQTPLRDEQAARAEAFYIAWHASSELSAGQLALIKASLKQWYLDNCDIEFATQRFLNAVEIRDRELLLFYARNATCPDGRTRLDLDRRVGAFGKPLALVAAEARLVSIAVRLLQLGAVPTAFDNGNFNAVHRLAANGTFWHIKAFARYIDRSTFQSLASQRTRPNGWTPLHLAAQGGCHQIVNFLISAGADRKVTTVKRREMPLHIAARWGRETVVAELLKRHREEQLSAKTMIHTASRDYPGYTPFLLAIMGGDAATARLVLQELLKAGLDPLEQKRLHKRWGGLTALHLAAMLGHAEAAQALMKPFQDLDNPFVNGTPYAARRMTPVHLAARYDRPAAIAAMLQTGANPDSRDMDGNTALVLASKYASAESVRTLLSEGANPTFEVGSGTALVIAIKRGSINIVKELLNHKRVRPTLPGSDKLGFRPIDHAVASGNPAIVAHLLANGDSANGKDARGLAPLHVAAAVGDAATAHVLLPHSRTDLVTNVDRTALHIAAWQGELECFRAILDAMRTAINQPDLYGKTPLHYACEAGHRAIVTDLLAEGADPEARNLDGSTPLMLAAHDGHPTLIHLLWEAGASINTRSRNGATALGIAAMRGQVECVRKLLSVGADPDAPGYADGTALHSAVQFARTDVVEILLSSNAHANARNDRAKTPLHNAAYNGHVEAVELLITAGAELNAADDDGETPLQVAIRRGNVAVADLLSQLGARAPQVGASRRLYDAVERGDLATMTGALAEGADPNVIVGRLRTCLGTAALKGDRAATSLLLDNGADISIRGHKSRTPLHTAAQFAHPQVLGLLLSEKTDVNALDEDGRTALHLASLHSNKYAAECIRQLIDRGASTTIADNLNRFPRDYAAKCGLLHAFEHTPIEVPQQRMHVTSGSEESNGKDAILEIRPKKRLLVKLTGLFRSTQKKLSADE